MLQDQTTLALKALAETDRFAETAAICSRFRISCEGWLKVELLKQLPAQMPDAEIMPELEFTDIVVRAGHEEILIELKSFPTNYGGGGKPITNFVGGVIEDVAKLRRKRDGGSKSGAAVFIAYPIPPQSLIKWSEHLGRIQNETNVAPREIHSLELPDGAAARLYVVLVD